MGNALKNDQVQILNTEIIENKVMIRLSITTNPSQKLEPDVIENDIKVQIKDNDKFGDVSVELEQGEASDIITTKYSENKTKASDAENMDVVVIAIVIGIILMVFCVVFCILFFIYLKKKDAAKHFADYSVNAMEITQIETNKENNIDAMNVQTMSTAMGPESDNNLNVEAERGGQRAMKNMNNDNDAIDDIQQGMNDEENNDIVSDLNAMSYVTAGGPENDAEDIQNMDDILVDLGNDEFEVIGSDETKGGIQTKEGIECNDNGEIDVDLDDMDQHKTKQ